jgi:hypothetical protein
MVGAPAGAKRVVVEARKEQTKKLTPTRASARWPKQTIGCPGKEKKWMRQVTEINDATLHCAQNNVGDPKMAQRLNWGGGEGREVRTSHIGRMVYGRAVESRSPRRRTSPNRSQGFHSGLSQGQLGWMLEGTERRFYAILGSVSVEIWTRSARNRPK